MATITGATARYQLTATGTLTGTNVTGSGLIGQALATQSFTTADIAYSIKITANAASDVAKLYLPNSTCVATTGAPVIADGDGKDIEGIDMADMDTGYAIIIVKGSANVGDVTAVPNYLGNPDVELAGTADFPMIMGPVVPSGFYSFTFSNASDTITVTVIGETA